jgi:hypothetical protein
METNHNFSSINGIVELGWVPWYPSAGTKTNGFFKKTTLGVFVQGGYKFALDSTGNVVAAGFFGRE